LDDFLGGNFHLDLLFRDVVELSQHNSFLRCRNQQVLVLPLRAADKAATGASTNRLKVRCSFRARISKRIVP
jgi:hypothetical protein